MRKTKVSLKDIMSSHPEKEYDEMYHYITDLIRKGELEPVKRAGMNGRKPALPLAFWRYIEEQDYSEILEELKFQLHPLMDTSYYRAHPDKYEQDKEDIQRLSDYLTKNSELLDIKETMNERSFEIFRREKFFQKKGGLTFCAKLGISREQLSFYETSEPLSYYSHSKKQSQNIMIIENKDTFYDLRRYMQAVSNVILDTEFDTLIYGAGKGIWKTFVDYAEGAEGYFSSDNRLLYFGDIDYEGILIYEHLVKHQWKNSGGKDIPITPFLTAYERMLDKAQQVGLENLPYTEEKQNNNIDTIFLECFSEKRRTQIMEILEAGKYVPQEILNEHDWG